MRGATPFDSAIPGLRTACVLASIALAIGAAFAPSARSLLLLLAGILVAIGWVLGSISRRRAVVGLATSFERIADGDFAAAAPRPADPSLRRLTRAAERALRASAEELARTEEEREDLRAALESVGHALVTLDSAQRIRSTNATATRLLGITAGDPRGRLLQEATRQAELNRFVEVALRAGKTTTQELRLEGASPTTVLAVGEPVSAAYGGGLLLMLTDVTRLRQLESMRTDFAANVSHELRTPITAIKGYLETMRQVGFDDAAQSAKFVEIALRNTGRLEALVEDILSLAWLEGPGNRSRLDPRPIAAQDLADAAVEQVLPSAKARRIEVRVDCPSGIRVLANETLVEQALVNLLSNAVKFGPEDAPVGLSVRATGSVASFTVRDTGPGIAAKHLPRIFERFYRVEQSRNRELGGTGLGLAIVKHIAAAHGGSIEVASTVGKGCEFTLKLPLVAEITPS